MMLTMVDEYYGYVTPYTGCGESSDRQRYLHKNQTQTYHNETLGGNLLTPRMKNSALSFRKYRLVPEYISGVSGALHRL